MSLGVELLAVLALAGDLGDVARPEWIEQADRGTPRFDLQPTIGLHFGFAARGRWHPLTWSRGELAIGGQLATHWHLQHEPGRAQPGVELSGSDTSVNLAPFVIHTFRLAERRLGLSVGGYTGISIRNQHIELRDDAHDLAVRHDFAAAFADLGVLLGVDVRLGARWGLALDGVVPLYLGPDAVAIPGTWAVTGPYVGLGLSFYL